jgi:prepilin-type N-terminal cleavage/methylation domain-containing protein
MNVKKRWGFTLIELMIVIAIIALLSMISIPSLTRFLAKAKRTEAYVNLSSLAMAEKTYWAEHGTYTNKLGNGGLNWKPEGNVNYTYGFPGQEQVNYYTGNLKAHSADLSGSHISDNGFVIRAVGDIDGDGKNDILEINQDNKITVIHDDLAD